MFNELIFVLVFAVCALVVSILGVALINAYFDRREKMMTLYFEASTAQSKGIIEQPNNVKDKGVL